MKTPAFVPRCLVLLGLLMVSSVVCAETDLVPQRIFLGMTSDPAHSQSVTWRTTSAAASPQAQVAAWSGDPAFEAGAVTVSATATLVETNEGVRVTHYMAVFEKLDPGKEFAYRVGDGTVWSAWNRFRTASAGPEKFRFIYLGDAQRSVKSLWTRVARVAFGQAPDARFIVHAGDLVEEGYDDAQWGEWCDGLGFIAAWIPNLVTPGNHDMNLPKNAPDRMHPKSVSALWRAHFAFPSNGPADAPMLEDETYYVDYQGMRLISFEANAYSTELYDPETRKVVQEKQVVWMEQVLRDNPNRWTVVLQHEPAYRTGKNDDCPELRAAFVPLYDQYHVDLVLQGHDHVYARSQKLAGGKVVGASEAGTVYVVSVSGPRMYPFNKQFESLMAKEQANTQMFQVVAVDGDRMLFEAYSVTGDRIDAFELRKDQQNVSTYTDLSTGAAAAK